VKGHTIINGTYNINRDLFFDIDDNGLRKQDKKLLTC